jgi:hypothetical protein
MSRVFHKSNRIGSDSCALTMKELQNESISQYYTNNFYSTNKPECSKEREDLANFSLDNYQSYRDGYGVANSCVIDKDTDLRYNSSLTGDKDKEKLQTRIFHAIPNLNKGKLVSDIEVNLIQGANSGLRLNCEILTERDMTDLKFTPLLESVKRTQNPENIVEKWKRGGTITREVGVCSSTQRTSLF